MDSWRELEAVICVDTEAMFCRKLTPVLKCDAGIVIELEIKSKVESEPGDPLEADLEEEPIDSSVIEIPCVELGPDKSSLIAVPGV
jgi:hypothetical protein